MKTFAKTFIQGYVGKITEVGQVLKIRISGDYPRRDSRGDFENVTYWNTVTVFDERRIKFIRERVSTGDLVQIDGTLAENSYVNQQGETVYDMTIAVNDFTVLSWKAERDALKQQEE